MFLKIEEEAHVEECISGKTVQLPEHNRATGLSPLVLPHRGKTTSNYIFNRINAPVFVGKHFNKEIVAKFRFQY